MAITVNGQEYQSWDDVPDDVRATLRAGLPDSDGDGVPDLLEGDVAPGRHVVRSTRIKVHGRVYESVGELSPEMRAKFEAAGIVEHSAPEAPPSGPVVLNGVPVAPPGKPQKKKHWWQRG